MGVETVLEMHLYSWENEEQKRRKLKADDFGASSDCWDFEHKLEP